MKNRKKIEPRDTSRLALAKIGVIIQITRDVVYHNKKEPASSQQAEFVSELFFSGSRAKK